MNLDSPLDVARTRWTVLADLAALRLRQAQLGGRVALSALRGEQRPRIHSDRDFGNIRDKGAQEVRVADTPGDAAAILRAAYAARRPVNVGASFHSSNGQTLSRDGLRLRLNGATWGRPRMLKGGLVDAPAAISWDALERFLRGHGSAAPVLTDNLDTTIGGTLSVGGGIGTRSAIAGRQLDHVARIRLLLPQGEAIWASPDEHRDLFRFVFGGQGILGVLDRVVLWTAPRRPHVALFRLQFRSLREAAAAAEAILNDPRLAAEFAHLEILGPIINSRVVELTIGFEYAREADAARTIVETPEALADWRGHVVKRSVVTDVANFNAARSAPFVAMLTAPWNRHVFYWNDYMFPSYARYDRFLEHLERAFANVGNEHLLAALGLCYRTFPERPRSPLAGLEIIPGERPYSVGLNYAVREDDSAGRSRIAAALAALHRASTRMGGRLYRYGYCEDTAAELEAIYGDDYRRLMALKREVDPENILNPDVLR